MFTPLKINLTYTPVCNVQNNVSSTVYLSMLRLTRQFNLNYHQPRLNSTLNIVKPVLFAPLMAETSEKTESQPPTPPLPAQVAEEKGVKKEKAIEKPTPPEKPEAGDCCGSGCVRCVWDIYYDELDSYNQLLEEYNSAQPS